MSANNTEIEAAAAAGVVTGLDPAPASVREYLAEIGRRGGLIGGRARSKRKAATSRANGFKGGRPRKVSEQGAESKT